MSAVVSFQTPYLMLCPLFGKTLVKKPVVLNVYKQKTPRMWYYYSLNLIARITSEGKSICWTYSLVITLNLYSVSKLFC